MTPRNPVAAFIGYPIGAVLAGAGLVVGTWIAVAFYKVELAFDSLLWALTRSGIELTVPPEQLANDMIQRGPLVVGGIAALIVFLMGTGALREARTALRPIDMSEDGKARITLNEDLARAGRAMEGSVRFVKDPTPGEAFTVTLSCRRSYKSGDDNKVENAFREEQEIQAQQDAQGWIVPFGFKIPAIAPASSYGRGQTGGYRWQLAVKRAKSFLASPAVFELQVAPALESELRALEAGETPGQKAAIEEIESKLKVLGQRPLLPHQRAELRNVSDKDLAMIKKVTAMPGKILKWIGVIIVILFVLPPLFMFLIAAFIGAK
jgi:hypothetical protein